VVCPLSVDSLSRPLDTSVERATTVNYGSRALDEREIYAFSTRHDAAVGIFDR
jgi:hypothetical protein